jgi:hypothetical protein
MWFSHGKKELSIEDATFLSSFGTICGDGYDLPEDLQKTYLRSCHPNLGDIIVIANPGSTFLKRRWIRSDESKDNIIQKRALERYDIPIGEHGTNHPEDSRVLFRSNKYLEKYEPIENVKIRTIIEEIIKAGHQ